MILNILITYKKIQNPFSTIKNKDFSKIFLSLIPLKKDVGYWIFFNEDLKILNKLINKI